MISRIVEFLVSLDYAFRIGFGIIGSHDQIVS